MNESEVSSSFKTRGHFFLSPCKCDRCSANGRASFYSVTNKSSAEGRKFPWDLCWRNSRHLRGSYVSSSTPLRPWLHYSLSDTHLTLWIRCRRRALWKFQWLVVKLKQCLKCFSSSVFLLLSWESFENSFLATTALAQGAARKNNSKLNWRQCEHECVCISRHALAGTLHCSVPKICCTN